MPPVHGDWAGHERGLLVIAVIEDFEQITLGLITQGGEAKIIDYVALHINR